MTTIDSLSPRAAFSIIALARIWRTAAGLVGVPDALGAVDEAGGGEVGAGELAHELAERGVGMLDQLDRGVDDLREVVRRDVRRHAHGDAGRAVDQEVRELRRQDPGLEERPVVVRRPVDGLLVDVVAQHLGREAGQPHLGVAHGRGVVAVDRAEVALAVDERVAQRELLRHAHDRVVDRALAVRVVLAEDVADDAGGLAVRLVVQVALLPHAVEAAAVDGLQPVAHVRQRPSDDDGHGVVEVRPSDLVFDRDGNFFVGGQEIGAHAFTCHPEGRSPRSSGLRVRDPSLLSG